MEKPLLSIKAVAQRSGLTPFVIRVWEKRHGVVQPVRTGTNRRRYTAEQADHLALLARLTQAGHPIGTLAQLSREQLSELLRETENNRAGPRPTVGGLDLLGACVEAIRHHDQVTLEQALSRAEVTLGAQGMLMQVAAPLAQMLGELWREGTLSAAHEHFASSVLRGILSRACRPFALHANAPVLIVATPAGQLHELGALLAAAAASNLGWRVVYLGASLPAAEIAGAALQHKARAVGLSLVYPEDDPNLGEELSSLRRHLPAHTAIIAGGRAVPSYRNDLERIGVLSARDLAHLSALLDGLRLPASASPNGQLAGDRTAGNPRPSSLPHSSDGDAPAPRTARSE